jgi:6-phosphofructokinase
LKGNVVITQSGGPTAVINSSIAGIVQEALRHQAIENIYGAINGIEGVLKEELIDLRREGPETIQQLRTTPSAALGSCRWKMSPQDFKRTIEVFRAHNVRCAFFIGGNDTMQTADAVSKSVKEAGLEVRVIGVPKTIDNDLVRTDHCPGYGSVARWWAIAARDAALDTDAIYHPDTVKVLETMGRDTGWIAASTSLARENDLDPPHLIYLPERPLDEEKFLADVDEIVRDLGRVVIVAAEGLTNKNGESLSMRADQLYTDKFGHSQPGGVANYLCNLVSSRLKLKARSDKPGTIQRVSMVCASEVDLEEAYLVGKIAVRQAVDGTTGYMVTLQRSSRPQYECETGLAKLEEVAGRTRTVPQEFVSEKGNSVTKRFIDYAKPLIGSPLPKYARLKKFAVEKRLPPYLL